MTQIKLRYHQGNIVILYILPCGTVNYYIQVPSQTQIPYLYALYYCGDRDANQLAHPYKCCMHGIMHLCVTTYSPWASPLCCMWLLHLCIIFHTALVEVYILTITYYNGKLITNGLERREKQFQSGHDWEGLLGGPRQQLYTSLVCSKAQLSPTTPCFSLL